MKREVMERWVEALRSGEYTQSRSALQDQTGFCCLGVLCDIASKDGIGTWQETSLEAKIFLTDDDEKFGTLSNAVIYWSGMVSGEGKLPELIGSQETLWELNDREGYDFDQIADVIEKHWEEL